MPLTGKNCSVNGCMFKHRQFCAVIPFIFTFEYYVIMLLHAQATSEHYFTAMCL